MLYTSPTPEYDSLLQVPYWDEPFVMVGAAFGLAGVMLVIATIIAGRRAKSFDNADGGQAPNPGLALRENLISIGAIITLLGFAVPFVSHVVMNSGYTVFVYEKIERNVSKKYDVAGVKLEEVRGVRVKETLESPHKVLVDESTGNYVAIARVMLPEGDKTAEYRYDVSVDPVSGDPILTPITEGAPKLPLRRS
jgi:hypothetical protein